MVPKGWKLVSLGDVCNGDLQTGPFGSQLHAHEYVPIGVPVLMPKDLIGCKADISQAAKITPTKANELKKHFLKSGDLLFSRRGDVARFALINIESEGAICGTGCLKARPSKNHSSNFLAYFLQKNSVRKWLEQNAVGQTMPNMNTEILHELPLMIASSKLEEEKIAQILSTWDRAISVTEKLLSNSQQQKKALMQQLLTGKKRLLDENGGRFIEKWKKTTLGDIAKITTGSSNRQDSSLDGKYTFFDRSEDIRTSNIYLFDGEAIIVPGEGQRFEPKYFIGKFDLHQRTYAIMDFASHSGRFLFYMIDYLKVYFLNQAVGSTVKSLRLPMFQKMTFEVPEIEEQQKIAAVLSAADTEISMLEKKLAYLKDEKKALMQQLLTGKRRVTVDADAA
ncbi:restriction endonuclease subunit S [Rosenbergiella metrosideri]|uniref:restriction endonuclease subunit S n=1 Tax=Rosenbergiella metrosideri TaxID=2921185 RepID=UPI001F4FDCE8|nr:restriction endonuclease subunit S [Rosenbergiella metrosideri]